MHESNEIEILHAVNAFLFSAVRSEVATRRAPDFAGLRREIRRATDCLRSLPTQPERTSPLNKELADLQSNLQQLEAALPGWHIFLVALRSRLAAAQSQLAATGAWVQANKETL